jgi:outer membrane protein
MFIAIVLSLAVQAPPDTVVLSLDGAIERALAHNPSLMAERAEARSAGQLPATASRAFLPSIQADVMGMRTTDPVAVFGLKLRQAAFQMSDLALDALNDPVAYGGFMSTATAELPLVAPEGWFGYAAARRAAAAREAGAERAAGATAFFATQAYLDAQLAERRVGALDTALAAARAHATQAEQLHEQGLVTGLDARLARLGAAALEVRRLAALAEAENAGSRLRALLALPESTTVILSDSLTSARATLCPGEGCLLERRGDVRALSAGAEAAALNAKSAWAAQLPQLGAFGTLAYHGHDTPWGGGSGDWTVGIALRWNVFPALAGIAAVRRAGADRDAARARYDAARRQAEVQVLQAERMLGAARESAAIAARAEAEAKVALEQAQVRYRTGAAPITELLDVQTAATDATLNHLTAQHDLLLAQAALELAYGVHDR